MMKYEACMGLHVGVDRCDEYCNSFSTLANLNSKLIIVS